MKLRLYTLVFFIAFNSIAGYCQLITEGLVAYYPFLEDVMDHSDNSHDGILNDAFFDEDRYGNPSNALAFSNDAHVNLGNVMNEVFVGPDKQFSISAWIKPSEFMSNNSIITKVGDFACGSNNRQFTLRLYPNEQLSFTYYSSLTTGNARRIVTEMPLNEYGKWYHIVVTYDGKLDTNNGKDRVRMWVNCKEENTYLETSSGFFSQIPLGSAHLSIGSYLDENGIPCNDNTTFKGTIDDVYIFDRLLEEDEISLLGKEIDDVYLGRDIIVCEGTAVTLSPILSNAIEGIPLVWQDGSTTAEFIATEPGTYWVEAGNNCTLIDTINVYHQVCTSTGEVGENCTFTIPTLITRTGKPFSVKSECTFQQYSLSIFSNAGQLVFENTNPQATWPDDYFCPSGMYYYVIQYRSNDQLNNNLKRKVGKFVVLDYTP